MATFDVLIDDLASRFGLGANSRVLVREVLAMIAGTPGGLGGFLAKLKTRGLTWEIGSWLGRPQATALSAQQIERALGSPALGGLASRVGLTQGVVATATGYALPKIVGLLTPGGVVPDGVPAEITKFLSPAPAAVVPPRGVDAPPSRTPEPSGVARWLWPALAALVVVGLLSYFWSTLNRMPSGTPVANAPEPAAQAPATAPATEAQQAQLAPAPAPAAPAPPPATEAQQHAAPSCDRGAARPALLRPKRSNRRPRPLLRPKRSKRRPRLLLRLRRSRPRPRLLLRPRRSRPRPRLLLRLRRSRRRPRLLLRPKRSRRRPRLLLRPKRSRRRPRLLLRPKRSNRQRRLPRPKLSRPRLRPPPLRRPRRRPRPRLLQRSPPPSQTPPRPLRRRLDLPSRTKTAPCARQDRCPTTTRRPRSSMRSTTSLARTT